MKELELICKVTNNIYAALNEGKISYEVYRLVVDEFEKYVHKRRCFLLNCGNRVCGYVETQIVSQDFKCICSHHADIEL